MKAAVVSVLDVLGERDAQFVVPIFQRVYSWTARECTDLLDDVMRAGRTEASHFMGPLLVSRAADAPGDVRTMQVIDGQQRMTTLTLMLLAFVQHLETRGGKDAERALHVRERYLVCNGGREPKLVLSFTDEAMLEYLLGLREEPEDVAKRLVENLSVFAERMAQADFDADAFWLGCVKLEVLSIQLEAADSPQEVFESLNAKGKRLAIEDLVRNAILQSTRGDAQAQALYQRSWMPLEEQVEAIPHMSMEDVLCSWIAARHDDVYLDSKSEVFPLFKESLAVSFDGDCARLLDDVRAYAERLSASEQWRRQQMDELDRWLQGKPRAIISERKLFGD